MNFNGNFNKIGDVDITSIKDSILNLPQGEWLKNKARQNKFRAHKFTQTIHLVFDSDFRHINPTVHPIFNHFKVAIEPVLKLITSHYQSPLQKQLYQKYGNGYFVRINLVKLLPGGDIPYHLDKNFSLSHAHRIHLAIQTNDKVFFTVDRDAINIKEGEVIEINNKHYHCVSNDSESERIHMIFDFAIPGEQCCCGQKNHPMVPCNPRSCYPFDNSPNICTCFLQ